jgi:hypothetical protein
MFAFISRNAAMTVLLGVGWTIIEMFVIGFFGEYKGGSLVFFRQFFPGFYVALFYSDEYSAYFYNDMAFVTKGILTSVLWIGIMSGVGITLFRKNDIK